MLVHIVIHTRNTIIQKFYELFPAGAYYLKIKDEVDLLFEVNKICVNKVKTFCSPNRRWNTPYNFTGTFSISEQVSKNYFESTQIYYSCLIGADQKEDEYKAEHLFDYVFRDMLKPPSSPEL